MKPYIFLQIGFFHFAQNNRLRLIESKLSEQNVTHYTIGVAKGNDWHGNDLLLKRIRSPIGLISAYWFAIKKISEIKPTHIMFHEIWGFPILLFCVFIRKKVIYDVHENFHHSANNNKGLIGRYLRHFFHALNCFLATKITRAAEICWVPHVCALKVSELRNIPDFNSLAQYRNLPSSLLERKLDEKYIIYSGSLSIDRGLVNVARAICLLNSKKLSYRYKFILAGRIEDSKRIIDELRRVLNTDLILVDHIPREKLYPLIAHCDVGVHCPRDVKWLDGPYPMKVFEYLGLGIPAVVSNHSSKIKTFSNLVSFCNPESPESIAESILVAKRRGLEDIQILFDSLQSKFDLIS